MRSFILAGTLLLSGSAYSSTSTDQYTDAGGNSYPWCTSEAIGVDSNGWGWENEASCMSPEVTASSSAVSGTPTYGNGNRTIRVRYNGQSGIVKCTRAGSRRGEQYEAHVRVGGFGAGARRYRSVHRYPQCARNMAILKCSFSRDLSTCERRVSTTRIVNGPGHGPGQRPGPF